MRFGEGRLVWGGSILLRGSREKRSSRVLEKNPDYHAVTHLLHGEGRQQGLLWAAIVAAVVVLALLTFRLARS